MEAGGSVNENQEVRMPEDQEDGHSWQTFNHGFFEVQKILEENKVLIGEINHNQESKLPENLSRNVALIKELNSNMTNVVGLYSDLSTSFVSFMDGEPNDNTEEKVKAPTTAASVGQKRTRAT